MSTQVILLERVEKLGNMGQVVSVKPGYARNYLIPQKKALRASKDNIAYFESQKKHLEVDNDQRKSVAEKLAKKLAGLKVSLIRQASESGQLYGSVTSRDIATEVAAASGEAIERSMILVNQNYKSIGLFPVDVTLHPEVKAEILINIARSPEEAQTQLKTGKALVAGRDDQPEEVQVPDESALEGVLEDDALEAEKARQADAEEKAAEDTAKEEERAEKRAEKAEEKAAADAAIAEAEATEDSPSEETGEV